MRPINQRLSSLNIKNLSRILKPSALRVSPSVGLLTFSSPQLLANCRKSPIVGDLTNELYHQRSCYIAESMLEGTSFRYGPVAITKSRSRAAYWLSPSTIGTVVGLAKRQHATNLVDDATIDTALNSEGIVCNYSNNEWTGVSMARYRKLVRLLAPVSLNKHAIDAKYLTAQINNEALSVMLAFLWEKATSKQCLLDFFLAVERASGELLLRDGYASLRQPESILRQEWLAASMEPTDLTGGRTLAAEETLIAAAAVTVAESPTAGIDIDHDSTNEIADALDVLAASYALERSFKPPIKLGRYSYLGGKARPDCVEVVVREIVDSLIFDPITNRLCPERLPSTTQPAVRLFYASLQAGEIDDISTKPLAKTRQSPSKEKASATSSTYSGKKVGSKSRDADQQVTPGAKAETASVSVAEAVGVQYWEATSAGQAWFNLCSALPRGPQYLSSAAVRAGDGEAATEAPYELQPTMRNVCATLRVLLGLQRVAPVNSNNPGAVQEEDAYWSLKDVEDSWNEHVRTQASNKSGQDHAREICTTQGVVRFRAPFSDTEMIMRDVGSISFVGGRHSIDLELESAHQLATVKHRLGAADSTGWNNEAIMRIAQQYKDSARSVLCGSDSTQQRPPAVVVSVSSIVQSAVLGDRKLVILLELLREHSSVRSAQVDALVVDAITAARWGEERRTGADFAHSSSNVGSTASKGARVSSSGAGGGAVLSVTDASLTSADAQLRRQEGVQATLRALEAITHCSDPVLTAQLVHWMLQEAPQEVTVYQVASVLMRLDLVVRSHALFRSNLREVFAPGTEEGEGKARGRVQLLRHVLSFGTPQCPSKSFFFQSLPGSNAMSLYDRVRLFKLYFLFRLAK